jgi:hypothetical protein
VNEIQQYGTPRQIIQCLWLGMNHMIYMAQEIDEGPISRSPEYFTIYFVGSKVLNDGLFSPQ